MRVDRARHPVARDDDSLDRGSVIAVDFLREDMEQPVRRRLGPPPGIPGGVLGRMVAPVHHEHVDPIGGERRARRPFDPAFAPAMEHIAGPVDRAHVDLDIGRVGQCGLDLLGPLVMCALVLEIDQLTPAAPDIVARLSGNRRTGRAVDDLHARHVIARVEPDGQHQPGQVADDDPYLLENAVGIADLVDQLLLAAAPSDRGARPVQPQPNREGASEPCRTHISRFFDQPALLRIDAGVEECDHLDLAGEGYEGHHCRGITCRLAWVIRHGPMRNPTDRIFVIPLGQSGAQPGIRLQPPQPALPHDQLGDIVGRPGREDRRGTHRHPNSSR